MRAGWLLRDGEVLAAAEIAEGWGERARSLAGCSDYDHALVLTDARAGHTAFVPVPLDVAFVDREMSVVAVARVPAWRLLVPRPRARHLVGASHGSFERWGLRTGDVLELRVAS